MPTVRELRKGKKMSQGDLAKIAGVGLTTIHRLEKGHDVNPATLKAVADALEVQVSEITGVHILSRVEEKGNE